MNRVLFLGACDKSELLVYLSKLFAAASYKVLLIDATLDGIYQYAVSGMDDLSIAEYDGFELASGFVADEQLAAYDYVFIDMDHQIQRRELVKDYDDYVLVTNFERRTIAQNQALMDKFFMGRDGQTIHFNKVIYHVDCQLDEAYIDSSLAAFPLTWKEPAILIRFDEVDYAVKLDNQFRSRVELRRLSKNYRKALLELADRIARTDRRTLKKALKNV